MCTHMYEQFCREKMINITPYSYQCLSILFTCFLRLLYGITLLVFLSFSDISFLYDVPLPEKKLERPDKLDKSFARKEALDKQRKVSSCYIFTVKFIINYHYDIESNALQQFYPLRISPVPK